MSAAGGVVELFCDLAAISSPSRDERAVADVVLGRLRALGLDPVEDDSGARTGSNIGNIHVALPPSNGADGTPIFLNAHLDTVPPDGPVEPEVRNGIVVNAATRSWGPTTRRRSRPCSRRSPGSWRVRRTPGWSFC